jgi:hypothetical protein
MEKKVTIPSQQVERLQGSPEHGSRLRGSIAKNREKGCKNNHCSVPPEKGKWLQNSARVRSRDRICYKGYKAEKKSY